MSRAAALLLGLGLGLALGLLGQPAAAAERVLNLATGRGESMLRVLVLEPAGPPRGALVLLAGGDGSLDLAEDGRIRALGGNQLVRTRADYVAAGWLVALPDMPLDTWRRRPYGRLGPEHAADLGLLVALLHRETRLVVLAGTSMGSLSAANAAARLAGQQRPDALVLTAGLLMAGHGGPNVEEGVPGLAGISQPVLLLHHRHDACRLSPASGPALLQPLLRAAPRVDVVLLEGGGGTGNPCEARSPHGFWGLDDQVVRTVAAWLAGL